MRETTLDPSFPRFIVSPSQCHTAAGLSSTQVHGSSLGPASYPSLQAHTTSYEKSNKTIERFKLEETMQKRSFISK